jgi:20S proteasome subunit beta 2
MRTQFLVIVTPYIFQLVTANFLIDSFSTASDRRALIPRLILQTSHDDYFLAGRPSLARSRARLIVPDDLLDEKSDEEEHDTEYVFDDTDLLPLLVSTQEPLSLALKLPWGSSLLTEDSPPNNIISSLPTLGRTNTGTTIVGIYIDNAQQSPSSSATDDDNYGSFVVLAADTRATAGRIVADKRADKIHCLTPPQSSVTAFACGAGTSADLDKITKQCYYTMMLQGMEHETIGQDHNYNVDQSQTTYKSIKSPIQFETLCQFLQDSLYQRGGRCGANLIVGGASDGRCYLRAIHPHGSMDRLESFSALGSGGLAAMAVLESQYKKNMTKDNAIALAKRAILAGIENDLGSGSQVDLCIIYSSGRFEHVRA